MTAQIQDCYKHKRKKYDLVALSKDIGFDPRDYGMEPHMSSTACWRGYWCDYEITDSQLLLKNLYLFNSEDKYPPIMGVSPSPVTYHDAKCYYMKDGKSVCEVKQYPDHDGHRLYKNINMSLPYTGKILLGSGFIQDYYIHMGYQRSWAYKKLMEFVLENGDVKQINDLSETAKLQRKAVDRGESLPSTKPGSAGDIERFVTDSFSLDYKDKAWWLLDDD